ncbi:MAG: hypothetical protein WA192_05305 [Candidatus Acidiferrales bacterium]
MTNASSQSHLTSTFSSVRIPVAGAALLIVLGIAFQLGELGYGHLRLDNLWLFSMMLADIWNILSVRLNIPTAAELLRYWPLLLVGLGFAILLATQENRFSASRRS